MRAITKVPIYCLLALCLLGWVYQSPAAAPGRLLLVSAVGLLAGLLVVFNWVVTRPALGIPLAATLALAALVARG